MNQKDCILYDTAYKVQTPLLTNRGDPNTACGRPVGTYIGHAVGGLVTQPSGENVIFDQTVEDRVQIKASDTNKQEQKLMKLEWVELQLLDRAELNNELYLIAKMRLGSQERFDHDIWSNNKNVEFNIPIPLKVPKFPTLGDSTTYNLPSDCKCIPPQLSAGYWTEPSTKPNPLPEECITPLDYCPSLTEGRYFIIQESGGEVSIDLASISGQYTPFQLAQELQDLLNANTISGIQYIVQFDGLTNKYTIRGNQQFAIRFATGSDQNEGAYYYFGFPKKDSAAAFTHTSTIAFPPLKTATVTAESRSFWVKEKLPESRETAEFEVVIPNKTYTYSELADKLQECMRAASLQQGIYKKLGTHLGYQYIVTFDPVEAKFHIKTCDEAEKFSLLLQQTARTNKFPRILGFDLFNTPLRNCVESDNQVYAIDMLMVPTIVPYVADREPIQNPQEIELNDWGTVYLDDTYYCTQRVLMKPDEVFYMKIVKSDGSDFRQVTNPYLYLPCNHPLKEWLPAVPAEYDDPCGYPFQINNLRRFAALVSFTNVPLGYSHSDKNGRVPPPAQPENINQPVQGQYVLPPLIQDGRRTRPL